MLVPFLIACTGDDPLPPPAQRAKTIEVVAELPPESRCGGTSPEIRWQGVPEEATSLALALVRPSDQGPWVHWATWGIPADWTGLEPGIRPSQGPPLQGFSSEGTIGYSAPCPTEPTTYAVRLFALDVPIQPPPTVTWAELGGVIKGHTIAWGNLLIEVDDVTAPDD